MKTYLITELLPSCPRASSCTAETDFVHYICMAFYVRYSLHVMQFRCLYPICTPYVSTSTKIPKKSKKSKKKSKSQKRPPLQPPWPLQPSRPTWLSHSVKKQGQKKSYGEQKSDLDDSTVHQLRNRGSEKSHT
jgi:hypothetical protein